jgi:hypothetical protein
MLSVGSLLVAVCGVVVTALMVFTVLGEIPYLAGSGHWSGSWLAQARPFGRAVAIGAAGLLCLQSALFVRAAAQHGRPLIAAWRESRKATSSLIVIPDALPTVFAVPGWPGRIVASVGFLRLLTPQERRAVLAHEQAHLDGRHDLHMTAALIAVAINPLLGKIAGAAHLALERSADETAAEAVGDRRLVAETIARAAVICSPPSGHGLFTMAASGNDVVWRVAHLLDGPPRRRRLLEAALVATSAVALTATLVSVQNTRQLFERAEQAYVATSVTR